MKYRALLCTTNYNYVVDTSVSYVYVSLNAIKLITATTRSKDMALKRSSCSIFTPPPYCFSCSTFRTACSGPGLRSPRPRSVSLQASKPIWSSIRCFLRYCPAIRGSQTTPPSSSSTNRCEWTSQHLKAYVTGVPSGLLATKTHRDMPHDEGTHRDTVDEHMM